MYCRSTKIKNHLRIRHKIEQIESETLSSLLVQVRKGTEESIFCVCQKNCTHILSKNLCLILDFSGRGTGGCAKLQADDGEDAWQMISSLNGKDAWQIIYIFHGEDAWQMISSLNGEDAWQIVLGR